MDPAKGVVDSANLRRPHKFVEECFRNAKSSDDHRYRSGVGSDGNSAGISFGSQRSGYGFLHQGLKRPRHDTASTDSGGFLVGYRYHINHWLSAEGVYGYGRNSQDFFSLDGASRIQSNIHQATGGFVVNLPTSARFRIHPYVLAEGGALVFDPTGNSFGSVPGAQKQTVGVFTYGAGADFPLFNHVSLRAEYRGLVYSAPDFGISALNTNTITHTAQPSAGFVFRF